MKIERLDHLVLTVADLGATVDFYTRVLGVSVRAFQGGRLALRFGGQQINVHEAGHEFEPKARKPTPGSGDLCFVVEQPLAEWLERLAELGVPVIEGPVPRIGVLGPMTSVYFRDPDGNLLEIASYAEQPPGRSGSAIATESRHTEWPASQARSSSTATQADSTTSPSANVNGPSERARKASPTTRTSLSA